MDDIARRLYTAAQARELDRRAIQDFGISGYTLMQRAARACWAAVQQRWPRARSLAVICGSGNNGGDGYELARLARAAGWIVQLYAVSGEPRQGDAALACAAWKGDGGAVLPMPTCLPATDVVADALFGTGLSRTLDDASKLAITAIAQARAAGAGVVAIDIPSGLDATRGAADYGAVVQADLTVTFIGRKLGLHTGQGPAVCGAVQFAGLELGPEVHEGMAPAARLQAAVDLDAVLPPRVPTAHKGEHGHVLVVGGNLGMMGAALLAGRAALRAGAGLVSIATRHEHAAMLTAVQPELMCHGIEDAAGLRRLMARATVVAIGPGLGTDDWARLLWTEVMGSSQPRVLDADALNLLAAAPATVLGDTVLTPHPGEAARLLGATSAAVQSDRAAALHALQTRYGAAVVLKGAGTMVSGVAPLVCPFGNPGMAVGGMGDALTGIIAALRAQGLAAALAAQAGVLAHALAGDAAASAGERGLLPSDLIDRLRTIVNPVRRGMS
ncbi:bifunctional ADP-dependent NAD(P)H-hydrate dehydratase/NAD(P)H-hydrate epimerase [Solimonas variicoloris]|uniref:bifunctional ADP-dependent NAD(P)H-hydrate dehydratase/NAD(P)H-hydrate epimerase n=1 Tax=Solimonas variicoloris TaxID=254408 RepID=UPI0003A66155|nr:bifunctional ADP-dependent NAD(P)H-hydrate dehydratase/NAD(P)H-hydrate epimerase [Solimonas variicoloris]